MNAMKVYYIDLKKDKIFLKNEISYKNFGLLYMERHFFIYQ